MRDIDRFCYYTMNSQFGWIIIVWRCSNQKVVRIFLPGQYDNFRSSVCKRAIVLRPKGKVVRDFCARLSVSLQGKPVHFTLDLLDWSVTYPFQRRVLPKEYRIPRGMVCTYGRLAAKLGHPRAARAVGNALARNPFPIIIPCHRTIRSDGSLGGYAGGLEMKRRLLELEGIRLDLRGRVLIERLW
jgi:methylated-DNA-[protein]-cysteine S-methyltransferase